MAGFTEESSPAKVSKQIGGNFVPNSNLSNFLLKKGSSGSLQPAENNEYSYKIDLQNL